MAVCLPERLRQSRLLKLSVIVLRGKSAQGLDACGDQLKLNSLCYLRLQLRDRQIETPNYGFGNARQAVGMPSQENGCGTASANQTWLHAQLLRMRN